ncbi:unnamed protein product [Miscanthus lutarioriparius]|uniref:Disease resistance R13L4/SHOC-2-like LRR domain-containing protein n=1 Tax=Miscanthus lutarioriparius TaxID=422564 RepID=A0A811N6Z1_9POAL|nr:unnamed protein product [Miscanthus lutarioriparius]
MPQSPALCSPEPTTDAAPAIFVTVAVPWRGGAHMLPRHPATHNAQAQSGWKAVRYAPRNHGIPAGRHLRPSLGRSNPRQTCQSTATLTLQTADFSLHSLAGRVDVGGQACRGPAAGESHSAGSEAGAHAAVGSGLGGLERVQQQRLRLHRHHLRLAAGARCWALSNNMGITGAIPSVIGELSHLRSLDVSNNNVSGPVPTSVGNLTRLESLFMNNNNIYGTTASIFSNLLPLRRLRNLDVSYNLIIGAIPLAIGSLGQLQSLNVSDNISGTIPPSIGNLTLLEFLYMQDNFISGGIPLALSNLTSLKVIEMSANKLTGQIPAELSNLRNIEAIDLGSNQLHGGIPPSLSELTDMSYLGLRQNNLSVTIPPAIFLSCTQLGLVDVGNNSLSGEIPRAISSTKCQFVVINLYSNKLQGTLPRWIANCTDLMTLDVESNLLDDELTTSIISGKKKFIFWSHDDNSNLDPFFVALSNCTSLQEVEAAAVGMGGQLPSRLGSLLLRNMWHLNLVLNAIDGPIPASIEDMTCMTLLNLSSNLLNGTIPMSLCRLESLERLVLSNNALTGEIPACIGNATHLGVLDLGNNHLSGEIPRAISMSTEGWWFLVLNLYSNNLRGTLPRWLANCTTLMILYVENNLLDDELPTSIISGMKGLMYLDLSDNRFRSHDDNNLEPFFAALSNCTSLQDARGTLDELPS